MDIESTDYWDLQVKRLKGYLDLTENSSERRRILEAIDTCQHLKSCPNAHSILGVRNGIPMCRWG